MSHNQIICSMTGGAVCLFAVLYSNCTLSATMSRTLKVDVNNADHLSAMFCCQTLNPGIHVNTTWQIPSAQTSVKTKLNPHGTFTPSAAAQEVSKEYDKEL